MNKTGLVLSICWFLFLAAAAMIAWVVYLLP